MRHGTSEQHKKLRRSDDSEKFATRSFRPGVGCEGARVVWELEAWKALNYMKIYIRLFRPIVMSHSSRSRSAPIIIHITFSNWIKHCQKKARKPTFVESVAWVPLTFARARKKEFTVGAEMEHRSLYIFIGWIIRVPFPHRERRHATRA